MPVQLGQHRTNYNMQDTVLAQLLYHLNTAHTNVAVSRVGTALVHHLQMLAKRCINDCTGDNTIPANMPLYLDPPPQRSRDDNHAWVLQGDRSHT